MLPEPLPRADVAARGKASAESRTSRWMRFMEPPIRGNGQLLAIARRTAPTVSFAESARNRHASARPYDGRLDSHGGCARAGTAGNRLVGGAPARRPPRG